MYKNQSNHGIVVVFLLFLSCFLAQNANAQFSLAGQLRTRGELRDGYATLIPKGNKAAAHIGQRTRLTARYLSSKLIFQTSLQDVRIWGQDASTITPADGAKLAIHEAWAELVLSNKKDTAFKVSPIDYFGIKIGRQEISYDDERLLGATDWLPQARRHDAILFKMLNKGWQLDLGLAFNQNSDAVNYNGTFYTPANVPATLKDSKGILVNTPAGFVPLVNAAGIKTKVSGLFLADQFGKYILDSVKSTSAADAGYVYGKRFNQTGTNTRFTTGLMINPAFGDKDKWAFNGAYYYQGGHDSDGLKLKAYTYTVAITYKTKQFGYTAGLDELSGNDALSTSTVNHRFDPLYGTPHKFWGYMDYFYAVSGAPTGGLTDPYLKVKYTSTNSRFTTELAGHYFSLANNQKDISGTAIDKYLGTELDLTAGYKLNKFTTVDAGISYMAATSSMEYAKNIAPGTAHLNPVWAYLQINIKPEFLNK